MQAMRLLALLFEVAFVPVAVELVAQEKMLLLMMVPLTVDYFA